jgi:hypothetical protein
MSLDESHVEEAALDWFRDLGYTVVHGPTSPPGEAVAERASFDDVALVGRLRVAIHRLNPRIPGEAQVALFMPCCATASRSNIREPTAASPAIVSA